MTNFNTKRIVGLVAAVGISLVMTGCSDDEKSSGYLSDEEAFVMMTHRDIPSTIVFSDSDLVEQGENICEILEPEAPISTMELGAFSYGFYKGSSDYLTDNEAATFVGYSVGAFCPDVIR